MMTLLRRYFAKLFHSMLTKWDWTTSSKREIILFYFCVQFLKTVHIYQE